MNAKKYLDLMKKHRKDLDNFPMAWAFNDEQLKEALEKLGAKKEECVTLAGHGDIMKRTDVPAFKEMIKRHNEELQELLGDKEAAEEAFLYEMGNHEYAINWSGDEDVLDCFNLTEEKLYEMGLRDAYLNARRRHMKHAREWDMI